MKPTLQEVNRLISELSPEDRQKIHDGYHTISEVYNHRNMLFVSLCRSILFADMRSPKFGVDPTKHVWKSRRDASGEHTPGWFLLGVGSIPGHIISYHLPDAMWDEAYFAVEIEKAHYDGFSSAESLKRLQKMIF